MKGGRGNKQTLEDFWNTEMRRKFLKLLHETANTSCGTHSYRLPFPSPPPPSVLSYCIPFISIALRLPAGNLNSPLLTVCSFIYLFSALLHTIVLNFNNVFLLQTLARKLIIFISEVKRLSVKVENI